MRRVLLVLILLVISSEGAFPAMLLAKGAGYYWRVRAKTALGTWGTWTQAEAFMVEVS